MPEMIEEDVQEAGLPVEAPATLTLDILRHSAAHLMAAAVTRLFPGAQYDVGPAIQDGFFYNFRLPEGAHFSEEDLATIEAEMEKLALEAHAYERKVMARKEARELFSTMGQTFKVDIIDRLPGDVTEVTVYTTGDFVDLCRGPHVPDSSKLTAVKLLRVAGVYWRGDEKNEQLQRVYGTAWFTKEDLEAYLERVEEAKRRDHRKLGAELDLYSINDEVGGGLVLWHPKGAVVRQVIEDYWRSEHRSHGYDLVYSPHIADHTLWETSRHVDFYAENMFSPIQVEDKLYQLKPMNCPFHIMIYKSRTRSYRDLPLRYAELGNVYRFERSGVLHGLLRVRGFTQDDAHLFCRPDQINDEVRRCVEFSLSMLSAFGFHHVNVYLSTKPAKAVGEDDEWKRAEDALQHELDKLGVAYTLQPGEGAFYGPKVDITLVDALGKEWQCGTVQFDFTQPRNFGLEYVTEDGTIDRPVMVHRALLGSIERFFGCLVEHYAGAFPLWLAPVQAVIALVQDDVPDVAAKAKEMEEKLRSLGIRARIDDRPGERMQARIRDAELEKVPYILVLGKKDVERGDDVVNLRNSRDHSQQSLPFDEICSALVKEAEERR